MTVRKLEAQLRGLDMMVYWYRPLVRKVLILSFSQRIRPRITNLRLFASEELNRQ